MINIVEIQICNSHKEMAEAMLKYCESAPSGLIARHFLRFNIEKKIIEVLPYSFPTASIPERIVQEMVGGEPIYYQVKDIGRLAVLKGGSLAAKLEMDTPWYSYGSNIFLTTGIVGKTVQEKAIRGFSFIEANQVLLEFEASSHFRAIEFNPLCLF
ncbi:hypothetical protein [Mastigocoleus testarum]|uniref:Uncharacterized protein n=1 Tax=Mastigocoleus testarum BC008 TaxID=371196 RepID=A0A0V7ZHJ7_9CYAN|nr:hypothetical protein [Mastigocoleus testarum]KST64069.1 hypothetical protein BC008_40460 [Mastigocoleus testarum BC008]KST64779.1 hypothetical protein BC008_41435 [Mastigocoleus testarum BC008]